MKNWRFALAAVFAMMAGVLAGCSGPASAPVSSPSAVSTVPTVSCVYTAHGTPSKPVQPPSGQNVPSTGTLTVTMHMDAGDVVMSFDRSGAPCAVHSFESLAAQKFFDDTSCHRLVPGFVLQCGDPTGTSTGGPGYEFADELSGHETYTYGTVAMANAGPNTNGSQFFIVLGQNVGLPPSYTVLGTVDTASMAVIESIAAAGVDPSDPAGIKPAEGGHIQSVTVS